MKIILKQLKLTNFKGLRSTVANFQPVTNVFGQNGTGKTTLMDAFLWLLFGKDSTDRKDFEIKTLDENNKPFHRLDHEVEATIEVDSETIILRRVFKEKWVKKRGSSEAEFNGHETDFFWNDVPMSQSEYQNKIAALLNENIFKLITNTNYFNSLKWQDRRSVLLSIAGAISNDDVFNSVISLGNKQDFSPLINALNSKKSIDEFKREIVQKKKRIREDLDLLPARIDEAHRSLPDLVDYAALQTQLDEVNKDLENVDAMLMNKSKAHREHQEAIGKKITEVQELRSQAAAIEFEEKNAVQEKKRLRDQVILNQQRELRNKHDELSRVKSDILNENKKKNSFELEANDLRKKWEAVNNETIKFNEEQFCCPTCKRAYEASDIESKKRELQNNFNVDKSKRLTEVTERGQKIAGEVKVSEALLSQLDNKAKVLEADIKGLEEGICTLQEEHARLLATETEEVKQAIAANTEYKNLQDKIAVLNEEIATPFEQNNSELIERKKILNGHVAELTRQLSTKEQREKGQARIKELEQQERSLAQELSTFEGIEYSIEQFTKAKMDMLEARINGRFKMVRFKMFEDQINGGQVECCTTLINGVPYPDANTASKIQAGLDIINTLSEHYGVTAPIFIDNRESVVSIPESESQIINLIVSAKHKKLTVGESVDELATA